MHTCVFVCAYGCVFFYRSLFVAYMKIWYFSCILKVCSSVTITYFLLFSYSRISPHLAVQISLHEHVRILRRYPLCMLCDQLISCYIDFCVVMIIAEQEKEKKEAYNDLLLSRFCLVAVAGMLLILARRECNSFENSVYTMKYNFFTCEK